MQSLQKVNKLSDLLILNIFVGFRWNERKIKIINRKWKVTESVACLSKFYD